jgi:HemY protein
MRRLVFRLIAAALVIAIAWWVGHLSGHVAATIAGTTIDTSTPVALVALVLLVLIVYAVLRLISALFSMPRRIGFWRARRRREAGDLASTRTLVALAAGDPNAARRQAGRARRLLGDTPQTLMHAAEAARLAGHEDEATALFERLAGHGEAGFLGLRGLFRQAMAREDWTAAAEHARNAEALRPPGGNWLRAERAELAVRVGNWRQAIALSGPDSPTAAFAVAAAQAEPDAERSLKLAARAVRDNPDFVPAATLYAEKLRASGRESRAQAVLRDAWKRNPHPGLAVLALAPLTDLEERLKAGTRLVKANPGHPESQLLLAQLAFDAGKMPDARRLSEAARNGGLNQPRLWKLIAEIDAKEGTTTPPPAIQTVAMGEDPGWCCEICHTALPHWVPVCPNCKTPGRVVWAVAPRQKLIAG